MKVVILAGGKGTRIGHRTDTIPKPMLEIGGRPILCHIMDIYSKQGFNDFIICVGYLGNYIKHWFSHYGLFTEDAYFVRSDSEEYMDNIPKYPPPWSIRIINTNEATEKGGRIKLIQPYIPEGEDFMITYGDGLADINITSLISHHNMRNKILTISAVHPPSRFGSITPLIWDQSQSFLFEEKSQTSKGWINGGFMIAKYELFDYLTTDCDFEHEIIPQLAKNDNIAVYEHIKEWECIDTERDYQHLNKLWKEGNAFWV